MGHRGGTMTITAKARKLLKYGVPCSDECGAQVMRDYLEAALAVVDAAAEWHGSHRECGSMSNCPLCNAVDAFKEVADD